MPASPPLRRYQRDGPMVQIREDEGSDSSNDTGGNHISTSSGVFHCCSMVLAFSLVVKMRKSSHESHMTSTSVIGVCPCLSYTLTFTSFHKSLHIAYCSDKQKNLSLNMLMYTRDRRTFIFRSTITLTGVAEVVQATQDLGVHENASYSLVPMIL